MGSNQRLRTGGGGFPSPREPCVYTVDMDVTRGTSITPGDVNSVGALAGLAGSDVCGLYWRANATFVEENFNTFYTKASGYAILMALLCLVQIYVLLKQLQLSSTQAAAAKVSLVTVGMQAVVDSYLCLLHLTTGIVAQHIFTLFATVSFFQLIIFSIFEMRFLLVIWKARRPHQFTEGWNIMRRELTTLYSRFYISLLVGLCVIYYGWYHPNLCIGLVLWMGAQVGVLLLQRYWGPRFFVPAMFLPVKYNYERRMDADQLSLLRLNQGDELDCVICMVRLVGFGSCYI
ncbi:hypothetical protein DYB30_009741 [Aphanomyces astaci]|uniref:RING-type E3 ubiquitin transferase n=1 Tax=Aphanomyces astaci TaxID=112090 RepID=A0A397CC31_APHAT|nr:hypothetical protein DYB30_009741 [Aphanomyces astaci]RHY71672.1 hypothetical protein DYB38_008976 [Aphanomyces astaci]